LRLIQNWKIDEAFFNIIFPIYPGCAGWPGYEVHERALPILFQQSGSTIKMGVFGFSGLTVPMFGTVRFPDAFSSARRGSAVEFLRTI
jgi:hypothetical protein